MNDRERTAEVQMQAMTGRITRLEKEVRELSLQLERISSQQRRQDKLLRKTVVALREKGIDVDDITD